MISKNVLPLGRRYKNGKTAKPFAEKMKTRSSRLDKRR